MTTVRAQLFSSTINAVSRARVLPNHLCEIGSTPRYRPLFAQMVHVQSMRAPRAELIGNVDLH
jgi:hypothetical protein